MGAATDTQEPAPTGTNEVVTAVAEQQNQGSGSTTAVTTRGRLQSGRSRIAFVGGRASTGRGHL